MEVFSVKVPIYPLYFCVVIGDDGNEFLDFLVEQGVERGSMCFDESAGSSIWGKYKVDGTDEPWKCTYLWLNTTKNFTHGVIAHEAYHCLAFILDFIGHLQDADNNEAEAYLFTWLINYTYTCLLKAEEIDNIRVYKEVNY